MPERQGSVAEVKLEIVHRDGRAIPMVMNVVRRERDGVPVDHVAAYVARDRDAYERELMQSRRKLQAAVAQATRAQAEASDRALVAEDQRASIAAAAVARRHGSTIADYIRLRFTMDKP